MASQVGEELTSSVVIAASETVVPSTEIKSRLRDDAAARATSSTIGVDGGRGLGLSVRVAEYAGYERCEGIH
jgi:hypothetical protein